MQPTPTYGLGLGESSYAQHQQPQHNQYTRPTPPLDSDELIPTAIVIKNIPFAVKKEQLQDIMQNLHLPLPYAFNYHFDSGVFRGLAFANFTSPEETTKVINAMNQMELAGRKLRVEYKKMLPAAERDRIERDKRERRGQLQEQHQPINGGQLHNQGSMTSLGSNIIPATTPSPISQRNEGKIGKSLTPSLLLTALTNSSEKDVDLNEPATLAFYTELTIFKNDNMRETMVFPNSITPDERRVIHTLAHHMGLEHRSEGAGENRQVLILKMRNTPVPQISSGPYYNESRRGLNRAATVDFTENRSLDSNYSDISLRRQGSHLLDIPGSPGGGGLSAAHNLRGAKSFADLRSYSPSPVASTASFPTNLAQNASRYTETYQNTNTSGTPTLTPTSAGGMGGRDELLSSMSSLALGNDRPIGARANYTPSAGPIGSQRPVNGNYDESSRNGASAVPQRQPKGPSGADWNQGFSRSRQNGHMNRGSGELDLSTVDKTSDTNRV
jgi:RNA recognition motif-containing protein